MTFGLKRVEILSAQANGVTLLVLAALIALEAVRRLFEPPASMRALILVVALAGIVVNLAATCDRSPAPTAQSLNVEGSFQHLLTDLYAFIGTAIAAVAILLTGFDRADAIASLLVAGLMLRSAFGLLRESGRIFLEAAPRDVHPDSDRQAHGRAAGRGRGARPPRLGGHLRSSRRSPPTSSSSSDADCHQTRLALAEMIEHDFDIHHTTLQVEHQPKRLLQIE